MFEQLVNGMFVGMTFDKVMARLTEMGFTEDDFCACYEGDEDEYPSITIGSYFNRYFNLDFDDDDRVECSYFGECED